MLKRPEAQAKVLGEDGGENLSLISPEQKRPSLWVRDAILQGKTIILSKPVSIYQHCLLRHWAEFTSVSREPGPGIG